MTVRTARKEWRCVNHHAMIVGNAPGCRGDIHPGERYTEGDCDPYLAGGFGFDKLCIGCEPIPRETQLEEARVKHGRGSPAYRAAHRAIMERNPE